MATQHLAKFGGGVDKLNQIWDGQKLKAYLSMRAFILDQNYKWMGVSMMEFMYESVKCSHNGSPYPATI